MQAQTREKVVSIVIPVFNQVAYTKQCLEAIQESTSMDLCEIVVVDNASSDETPSLLKSWKDRLRWIRNEKNMGFGHACNQGAEIALGEYIVFLNNDTKPLPKWVERCIAHFKWDPSVGIVGNKLLYPDGTIQHGGIEFVPIPKPPVHFPLHRFRGCPSDDPRANRCEEVHAVTAACLFIPKKLFWSVGGFPREYGMYFEDIDLNMQIRALGKKIIYEPRSVVIHYESKSSTPQAANELMIQSAQLFYQRWQSRLIDLLKLNPSAANTTGAPETPASG